MKFELFVSLRYLKARRKQTIVSITTAISIFGVALGVFALITVIAVMNGFQQDLKDKILSASSHIVIMKAIGEPKINNWQQLISDLKKIPEVTKVSPFIYAKSMISFEKNADGIVIKGISPKYVNLNFIKKLHLTGNFYELDELVNENIPGIILGSELAISLGVDIGDIVKIILPEGTATPGGMLPKVKPFKVIGIFNIGMFEYDSGLAFIHLKNAQKLFKLDNAVTGIEVNVKNLFKSHKIAKKIQKLLTYKYWVRDWSQMNKTFFSALKLEKMAMFLILVLIILVAAFNIVGTLTMMVMEKHKDIGILKSMGATPKKILTIFLLQGLMIGIIGTFIGATLGVTASFIAEKYKLFHLPADVYYLNYLPFRIQPLDVFLICFVSIFISLSATILPSLQAAKLDPVKAIRYE